MPSEYTLPAAMSDTILDRLKHDGVLLEPTGACVINVIRGKPLTINGVVADHRTARAVVETLCDTKPRVICDDCGGPLGWRWNHADQAFMDSACLQCEKDGA